jgi:hypothetical protein
MAVERDATIARARCSCGCRRVVISLTKHPKVHPDCRRRLRADLTTARYVSRVKR